MSEIDVAAISLFTTKSRKETCATIIPTVSRALQEQGTAYNRMPIADNQVDWQVNETDLLTVALDVKDRSCVIVVGAWGLDAEASKARLIDLSKTLCEEHDAHSVKWHATEATATAQAFLEHGFDALEQAVVETRITPRRVRAKAALPPVNEAVPELMANDAIAATRSDDTTHEKAMRQHLLTVDEAELEKIEWEGRRAKSVPMRLSAWALSISTAVLAAPLALPLIVHSLKRGEDVRAGAMAFGVAGLFAVMAQTGMAPDLISLL